MAFSIKSFKKAIPLLTVLLIGGISVVVVAVSKPDPQPQEVEVLPRLVRVAEAQPLDQEVYVSSQGTVNSRVEITLEPQVSGRIVFVSPNFVSGGFFKEGDVLVRIDPRDWELNVVRAEARVAEAQQNLARVKAEAEHARDEWAELGNGQEASPLVLHEPQLKEARARLRSAQADLEDARLDLERTEIKAPFDGRIKSRSGDVGQVISMGETLAEIFATDLVEVRLPLADRDIALLNLPYEAADMQGYKQPEVTFSAVVGGQINHWTGSIVRTEGVFDPVSRVLYVVAQVKDPYKVDPLRNSVPLSVGLFVDAAITGKTYKNIIQIPRPALRQDGNVLVVDRDSKIHIRPAEVVQTTRDYAMVRFDIREGERVCISPFDAATENMQVAVVGEQAPEESTLARGVAS
ncbi:MAG: efflux RND transporter periplasmic adaptor subunit [Alphaproteobacteria bacterium]|nr:MAG: efflux RND transporter periplasmic adaptor subunit [Alphaproteobacteria bacterium]